MRRIPPAVPTVDAWDDLYVARAGSHILSVGVVPPSHYLTFLEVEVREAAYFAANPPADARDLDGVR